MKSSTGTVYFAGDWQPFLFETMSVAVLRAHNINTDATCWDCEKRASTALVQCDGGNLIGAYCSACAKAEIKNQMVGREF